MENVQKKSTPPIHPPRNKTRQNKTKQQQNTHTHTHKIPRKKEQTIKHERLNLGTARPPAKKAAQYKMFFASFQCPQQHAHSLEVLLLSVGNLTYQQHASISLERIYSENCTCGRTDTEVAGKTFYFALS